MLFSHSSNPILGIRYFVPIINHLNSFLFNSSYTVGLLIPKITCNLSRWQKEFRESGDLESRGSGNFSSDEEKEIARLKRELRDTQDALDVLKKAIGILGK